MFITVILLNSVGNAHPRKFFEEIKNYSEGSGDLLWYLNATESAEMIMDFNALPEEMRWQIMLVTSSANECIRCVCVSVRKLNKLNIPMNTILALQTDLKKADINPKGRALLNLAY